MEKNENKMQNVYNLVIMDKSGSMDEIRNAAIEGFNDVLSGVRKLAKDYSVCARSSMVATLDANP